MFIYKKSIIRFAKIVQKCYKAYLKILHGVLYYS